MEINQLRHDQVFHYLTPEGMPDLELGSRVLVPFGKKTVQGWVVGHSAPLPGMALRPILSVIGDDPDFNPELLQLARWMADYYLHPLPEILKLMSAPEKPVRPRKQAATVGMALTGRPGRLALNEEQTVALREIETALREGGCRSAGSDAAGVADVMGDGARAPAGAGGRQFLLHGITGSGKTEVYLRAAMTALALGRQVLYLVPEIALTPQACAWFRSALGDRVAVWHSFYGI